MAQNYYQVMGIGKKATAEEIQIAYRKLAAEVYPGVNRGEEEATNRMKEINRAYETLRNADKRREYDEILAPGAAKPNGPTQPTAPSRPRTGGGVPNSPSSGTINDVFNTMRDQAHANATGQPATTPASPNAGPTVEIWLTPREAIDGAVKKIKVNGTVIRLKIGIRH